MQTNKLPGDRYRDLREKILQYNLDVDNLLIKWKLRLDTVDSVWYSYPVVSSLIREILADLTHMKNANSKTDYKEGTVTNGDPIE